MNYITQPTISGRVTGSLFYFGLHQSHCLRDSLVFLGLQIQIRYRQPEKMLRDFIKTFNALKSRDDSGPLQRTTMRCVLFLVSAHSGVWLGHTTHPRSCHRVFGSPAHRTMLPNRPTPLRLPGERGGGRSFGAGDCGPQPHTGAGGQLLAGRAARAPRSDLFFRVARGAGLAGRVGAERADGRRPKVSRSDCAPPPPPRLSPAQAAPTAQAPRPRPARPPARSSTFFSSFSLAPGGTPRMSYSFVSATFAMAACRAALASRRRSGRSATRTTSGGGAGRGDGEGTRAGLNFDPAQRHDVGAQARPRGRAGRLGGGRR